ncbi:MAG: FecR domain-containing protein [Myxococcota bacterium]
MNGAAPRKRYDFRKLVRRAHPEMTGEQELSGWHMLRQRGLLRERRMRRLRLAISATIIALASGTAGYLIGRPAPSEPLAYAMTGGHIEANGLVRIDADQGGLLRFSDGSVVRLLRGSVARLVRTWSDGARLRVSDGSLEVAVEAHVGEAPGGFEFDLGAYSLLARDAAFVSHVREREELVEVRVFSGSVELDGPLASDGLTLRAGQVLTIRRNEGAIVVRDAKTDDSASPDPSAPSEK